MKKTFVLASVLLLASCLGRSPDSSFYTLISEPTAKSYKLKTSLQVNEVNIPEYLTRPQIVTVGDNPVEIEISEFNRWSAPLSGMIQRIMADNLASAFPRSQVKADTDNGEKSTFRLQLSVNRLDASWDKGAVLDVWWTLSEAGKKVSVSRRTVLHEPIDGGYAELAAAQSRLLSRLSDEIASALVKTAGGK